MPNVDGGTAVTADMVPQAKGNGMMRTIRLLTAATCLVLLSPGAGSAGMQGRTASPTTAAAVKAVPVKTGLNGPSGFTFSPAGKIWYLERGTGEVRILNPKTGSDHLFFTIGGVDGTGERGALGIDLDPAFRTRPFVYVYVTRTWRGALRNQLVRIKKSGGHGIGLHVLVSTPASSDPYHNGGRILFGPDHKLYVMIGEGHHPVNAQDLTANLRGKILRLDRDGTPAAGDPHGRIWSFGHRNSFGFTFDPKTRRLWETENGPECNDEINLIVKGGNYGWGPNEFCGGTAPQDTNNSGPKPRHLPKRYSGPLDRADGGAFDGGRSEPPHLLQRTHRDLPARSGLIGTFGGRAFGGGPVRSSVKGGASVPRRMQGGLAVNIGRPKRIIEIEPATVPLPEPQMPMPEPGPAPVEPMPLELPVEPPGS